MKIRIERKAGIELSRALDDLHADDEDPDHYIMVEVSEDTTCAGLSAFTQPYERTIDAAKTMLATDTPFAKLMRQGMIKHATGALSLLDDEQRVEVFKMFCARCGAEHPHRCSDIDID